MAEPSINEVPIMGKVVKFPQQPASKARRKMPKQSDQLDIYFEELRKVAGPLQKSDREELFRLLYRFTVRSHRRRWREIGMDPDDYVTGLTLNQLAQVEANCRQFVDSL